MPFSALLSYCTKCLCFTLTFWSTPSQAARPFFTAEIRGQTIIKEKKVGGKGDKMDFFRTNDFFCPECKWPKNKKIKFDDKGKYCYNEDEFAKACKSG